MPHDAFGNSEKILTQGASLKSESKNGKNTSRKRDKDKKARVSIRRTERNRSVNHARKQNPIAQLQANKPANREKGRKAKNEE